MRLGRVQIHNRICAARPNHVHSALPPRAALKSRNLQVLLFEENLRKEWHPELFTIHVIQKKRQKAIFSALILKSLTYLQLIYGVLSQEPTCYNYSSPTV